MTFTNSCRSLRELPEFAMGLTHSYRCGLLIYRPLRGLLDVVMIMSLKLPEPANKMTVRRGLTFGFLLISVFLLTLTTTTVQPLSLAQAQRDRRIATDPTATPISSPATSPAVSRPVAASRNA